MERTDQSTLILVPSYNAERSLGELLSRLRHSTSLPILVIDDGSSDETSKVAIDAGVSCIRLPYNQGKGAALQVGFRFAEDNNYDSVITLDSDLQHLPEEVSGFLERSDGRTILIGTRRIKLAVMPFGRWLSNNWTSIIISIFSTCRVRDSQSGFRLLPISVLKQLPLRSTRYDFESELLFKAGAIGCPVAEVPVSTVYQDEKSSISPLKDTGRFIRQTWKRIWM